jgi:hypothetical protein
VGHYVESEILNHSKLRHPHVVGFREVRGTRARAAGRPAAGLAGGGQGRLARALARSTHTPACACVHAQTRTHASLKPHPSRSSCPRTTSTS